MHIGGKASSYRGECRRPLFHLSVCLSVCSSVAYLLPVCVFSDFTDCESCTGPISTNPRFTEAR